MTVGRSTHWVSWTLGRLDLRPADLAVLVRQRAGLPGSAEACELVDLHLAALDVSLDLGRPDLLVPQARWELTRWPAVAAGPPALASAVLTTLAERLDELSLAALTRHVGAAVARAGTLENRAWADRGCSGLSGLAPATATHLELAVAGRHDAAVAHARWLVKRGTPPARVLLDVLTPAQQELGRLWERGVLTPDREAVATTATRQVLTALSSRPVRHVGTAVAAAAPGDRHDLGVLVVADLLRSQGWRVQPASPDGAGGVGAVVEAVVRSGAGLVLLGASMTAHLPALRRVVGALRADPRCEGAFVLAGGEPFRHDPGLGEWVGADLVAECGDAAVRAAAGLLVPRARAGV